jgi:hypothetical protein
VVGVKKKKEQSVEKKRNVPEELKSREIKFDFGVKVDGDSVGYRTVYFRLAFPNAKELLYVAVGSYQGDFYILGKEDKNYLYYKGAYGSCSGCDWLESIEAESDKESFIRLIETMINKTHIIPKKDIENFLNTYVVDGMRDNSDEKEAKEEFLYKALEIVRRENGI